jgi:predicted peptidase
MAVVLFGGALRLSGPGLALEPRATPITDPCHVEEGITLPDECPIGYQAPLFTELAVERGGRTTQQTLGYLLYLPEGYGDDPDQEWPLVLFLHGRGERGSDPLMLLKHGPPKRIEEGEEFPFILVSPQCPPGSFWDYEVPALAALLDYIQARYAVDPDRITITGLSMGGYGTWAFAAAYPDLPAAIAPVAGGYFDLASGDRVPENICDLKDLPIWVFHGTQDDLVPQSEADVLVEALGECGVDVRYTVYPDADHEESFTRAYEDRELYEWLLDQER